MKQWEKLTAWLEVFALDAGLVGGSAFEQVSAAEENSDCAYAVNEDGTATITEVKTNAADVSVPAVSDGHTVTAIGSHTSEWSTTPAGAFESKWQAVNVYLPDTITSFADRAFASCAIEHIYRYDPAQISAEDIAVIGQMAENEYFGKPCGLLVLLFCLFVFFVFFVFFCVLFL